MGRSKRKRFRGERRTKEEWEEYKRQNPRPEGYEGYKLAPKSNVMFEKFYKGIGIVPDEEWDTFLQTMRKPLPATFRITGSRNQAQELLKIIKGKYFDNIIGKDFNGVRLNPICLSWYPDEMAWQLDFTKKEIRQCETLKRLHSFLVSETESGNISRQEAVSMLPPLLMDIKPHHKILDMCAAPGSKTAQLIEMLHSDENNPVPEGFVVANDMDNKRCYLMTHQVKRIQSPNCMIINHDARILPNMVTSLEDNAPFLKYDRILCDVPCSGDGTMRKNPDIWSKWNINAAYNLHRIQKKVLQRGLELLAVGGKLVYSTCSLNPVEDEAVILALIKQCGGAIELCDVGDQLSGLKYCKGTYSWKLLTKDKKGETSWYETTDQAPKQFRNSWDDTMYPPLITEAQEAKLERCIRVLPHLQNTGGFFIAVLQKTAELPWAAARNREKKPEATTSSTVTDEEPVSSSSDVKQAETSQENGSSVHLQTIQENGSSATDEKGDNSQVTEEELKTTLEETKIETGPPTKKQKLSAHIEQRNKDLKEDKQIKVKIQGYKEDPFYFCSPADPVWPAIKKFFKVSDSLNLEQLMFRNMKRVLYYVSKPIRNLVLCNDNKVKFINLGVKCFSNAPSPLVTACDYRLSQEGLLSIQQFIEGRRVGLTKQDVIILLSEENPFNFKLSPRAQEDVYAMDPGSALFYFKPSESEPEPCVEIVFCGWRGKTSVRSFVGKDERSHYLRLCGVELSDIQNRVAEQKAQKRAGLAGAETPIGPHSGDEAEVEKWNKEVEAPRGKEVFDQIAEDPDRDLMESGDSDKNSENTMEVECDDLGDGGEAVENKLTEETMKELDKSVTDIERQRTLTEGKDKESKPDATDDIMSEQTSSETTDQKTQTSDGIVDQKTQTSDETVDQKTQTTDETVDEKTQTSDDMVDQKT